MAGPGKIVVGYDGSQAALEAVRWAVRRVGKRGRVVVVYACGSQGEERGRAELEALLLEADNLLIDADLELEVIPDSPARAIIEAAELHRAEEIAIGSRGQGRLSSAVGSVCQELLQHSDRPVLVVPPGAAGRLSSPRPSPRRARGAAPA